MCPAQNGKASWVIREELAEAAAHVLTTEGHENKIYPLSNTESVSFEEIVKELSGTLNKEIQYKSPPVDEFENLPWNNSECLIYTSVCLSCGLWLRHKVH